MSESLPPNPNVTKEAYQYWAFISYSRKDEREAKKIHEFIETFGIPAEFVERHITPFGDPTPPKLKPCFRDKDDLPASPSLPKALREKLASSRCLVVICSPNSADSIWVNQEINDFKQLHGEFAENRIFPFIISGSPDFNARDCCFPPALKNNNPCAPNATKAGEGDRVAKLKLIAAMLDVSPDAVIRRDRERLIKKAKWIAAICLFVVMLIGWFAWKATEAAEAEALAKAQRDTAQKAATLADEQKQKEIIEARRQSELASIESGRIWLAHAKTALKSGDHLSALMLAGRAVGYEGFGRRPQESSDFEEQFPLLLAKQMTDSENEKQRVAEAEKVQSFIESIKPALLPLSATSHSEPVSCVAYSPDGTRIASGSWDHSVKILDASTGKEMHRLDGGMAIIKCLAFSPDGSLIASGDQNNTIRIWSVDSGKLTALLRGPVPSEGREYLSMLKQGADEAMMKEAANRPVSVSSIAFSPDGKLLASVMRSAIDCSVRLWNPQTGDLALELFQGRGGHSTITFNNDGTRLVSNDETWELPKGKALDKPQGGQVEALRFDSQQAAGRGPNHTIQLLGNTNGPMVLKGHKGELQRIIYSPDGSLVASCSKDKTIKLWSSKTGEELSSLVGHTSTVTSIAFSSDGTRLVSGAEDNTVKIWDVAMWNELIRLQEVASKMASFEFSPAGDMIAGASLDDGTQMWDSATGRQLAALKFKQPEMALGSGLVAFSPDGRRVASGYAWMVVVWDAVTAKILADLSDPNAEEIDEAKKWLSATPRLQSPDKLRVVRAEQGDIFVSLQTSVALDLASRLRTGLLSFSGQKLKFPTLVKPVPVLHVRRDALAELADVSLAPTKRAELMMHLCVTGGSFRAATRLWEKLLQGEWPGFEAAIVPKDQAPATIPADSPIRRLYLLALIDATKHPQIHGHPTICQTASQIAPVLTREMMATPTISLAMMSLMQTLVKDDSPAMNEPRAALMKKLEEVATKDWLAVLRETAGK